MAITICLSPATEDRLKEQAAASGRDVSLYAIELIEKAVAGIDASSSELSPVQRAAEWRAWAESHPRGDHFVDDSRESIYAGRGE
jgi:hypothetical protein